MNRSTDTLGRVCGVLAILGMMAGSAAGVEFQIKVTNLSPNVLSPVPFVTHDAGFDLFDEGAAASPAIEAVAETGNPSGVVAMAQAALGGSVTSYGVAGGAPLTSGQSAMVTLNTDMAHRWLSFASMMGVSNDGFIGYAAGDGAINLFPGGMPLKGTFIIMPANVWDAGTEVNDESATTVGALGGFGGIDEHGVITRPHPGILGIGDIPLSFNWTGGDVAMIEIVPEPATLALLAVGGLWLRRRRAGQVR